jgi:antitoxin (DNA-binding transcriptional repressor) of toxin-antitoxin stability system
MKASMLDIRRRMKDVLSALERNEPVTITYRGKAKGVLYPVGAGKPESRAITDHPAFGMWRDRKDMEDVDAFVRAVRKSRHAV